MLKSRRNYNEEQAIPNNLVYQIHSINNKIDSLLQSHKYMIDIVLKLLTSKQIQSQPQRNDYLSNMLDLPKNSKLLDSQLSQACNQDESELPSNIHNDDFINHIIQYDDQIEKDLDEFNREYQRMAQQEIEQSIIQTPQFQKPVVANYQYLFDVKPQKEGKLKLINLYKIIDQMQSQFKTMNFNFNSCECLYHYPQMVNQSFYQKITDTNHILFLAILQNQQVIGAFTQIGFSSKTNLIPKDNPKCCLFNLTRRHFLYAQRTNKTHSCDKSYILFGNWQFKIKVGESIMYSDLGTRGDCFKKQRFGANQKQINNTRQWIFGDLMKNQNFKLLKYMVCALK